METSASFEARSAPSSYPTTLVNEKELCRIMLMSTINVAGIGESGTE
jgi:hypothetical protein